MLKEIVDGIWSVSLKVLTILTKISILMKEKKKAVLTLSGNCYMTWLTHMFNLITHKTLIRSARLIINTQFTKYLACNLKKQYRVISYLQEVIVQEEFEGTKGVLRIRKSKNRQHNGEKKNYKMTNNDLPNIHIKHPSILFHS